MSLLSLDLTSALRVAVEQSMPRLRNDPMFNSVQAADRSISTGSYTAAVSEGETQRHQDNVSTTDTGIETLLTGGLLSTDPQTANAFIAYTNSATVITGLETSSRSTFEIVA